VEHYGRALERAEEIGDRDCASRCCLGGCLVEIENRRIQKAEVWFNRAKETIESLGLKDMVPRMLRARGRLHLIKGEQADAVEHLQAAKKEAQRLGQIHEVKEIERILGRINFSWLNGK
jgi:division protein CdvB (Snf7/Vps24/ESCRT-III family)